MTKCYMCDKDGTSTEHVPPQCLFPKPKDLPSNLNFRKNLITVPSCEEHNLQKSGDDEYLLFILVGNFNVNSAGLTQWRTKIRRSISKRPSKKNIFKNLQPFVHKGISTGKYEIDFERILMQFDRISRGIYYHHFQKHWPYEITLAIPFAMSSGSKETQLYSQRMREIASLAYQFLKDEPKLGDNPEIFYYQYKLKIDSPGLVIRMVFYGGIEIAAISGTRSDQPEKSD